MKRDVVELFVVLADGTSSPPLLAADAELASRARRTSSVLSFDPVHLGRVKRFWSRSLDGSRPGFLTRPHCKLTYHKLTSETSLRLRLKNKI